MGRKVNDWAWKQDLPHGPKYVLLCLAQYADNTTAACTPGIDTIAADCGYGEKAVREHRAALVHLGLIDVRRRSHRGRRTSDETVIVGYLRAVDPTAEHGESSGRSEGAKRSIRTSQAVDSTARSNKGTSQVNQSEETTTRAREPGPPEVEGRPITDAEHDLAAMVVGEFERHAGFEPGLIDSQGRATKELARIVARHREDPELTSEQHRQIVARCFADPIWPGDAGTVAVIYKPEQWPKAKAKLNGRGAKRHAYERDREQLADPGW